MNFISNLTNLPYFYHFCLFLLGLTIGVWVDAFLRKKEKINDKYMEGTEIHFRIFADNRTPERISQNNIWRWYFLYNEVHVTSMTNGGRKVTRITNLFLTFDRPVRLGTLIVSSPDFSLPRYEIKDFSNRSAVIAFSEVIPEGTLVIRIT